MDIGESLMGERMTPLARFILLRRLRFADHPHIINIDRPFLF